MTNTELDKQAHPWPSEGSRINFRFRRGVWAECAPMYNKKDEYWKLTDLIRVILMRGYYPFLTWYLGTLFGREVKGYIGWKPITMLDPAFFWQELAFVQKMKAEDALFLQLSVRGATAVLLLCVVALIPVVTLFWWMVK